MSDILSPEMRTSDLRASLANGMSSVCVTVCVTIVLGQISERSRGCTGAVIAYIGKSV